MGKPVSTSLFYKVTYAVIGSGKPQMAPTVQTESAKLNLQADKTYNIHVKAIRSDNHLVQSDWSDTLRVDSKNLGEFWYMIFWSCTTGSPNSVWEFFYGIILRNPQNGSDYKGFVWEFR